MRSAGSNPSCRLAAALLPLLLACGSGLVAQPDRPTEYQVKAAYLANFVKFIEWPATANTDGEPFSICILGQDPFGPVLDSVLAGETVDRHRLVPRRVPSAHEAAGCRVLYMGLPDEGHLKTAFAALDNSSILTVGDSPQFLKRGGMIQFVLDGNRVRFEVNLPAAKNAGLNLSSELLRVAAAVRKNL